MLYNQYKQMTNQQAIEQYLPKDLWEIASSYVIPEEFLKSMWAVIEMVLRSRSIDTKEEKQNWFNLLPLMNQDQISKLEAILIKEKSKLQEIEEKYEKKKSEIKEKYLTKRQEEGYVKNIETIKNNEATAQQKDDADAEELLNLI